MTKLSSFPANLDSPRARIERDHVPAGWKSATTIKLQRSVFVFVGLALTLAITTMIGEHNIAMTVTEQPDCEWGWLYFPCSWYQSQKMPPGMEYREQEQLLQHVVEPDTGYHIFQQNQPRSLGLCGFGKGNDDDDDTPVEDDDPVGNDCDTSDALVMQVCAAVEPKGFTCDGCGEKYVRYGKECGPHCASTYAYCLHVNVSAYLEYSSTTKNFTSGYGDVVVTQSGAASSNSTFHQRSTCTDLQNNVCTYTYEINGTQCTYSSIGFFCEGNSYLFSQAQQSTHPLHFGIYTDYINTCLGNTAGTSSVSSVSSASIGILVLVLPSWTY